ncbi:hypothetical protein [Methylocapsa palsarum]|uniref:MFS transporter, SHS family, lactate transporter n=1 Tax=Methylocapsa palsarum TaxID=1612308 RepID=A0A1I4DDF6_9HYPH|nr:hypothetical protein [Methylocapsa palsarum]SFK91125.1 MFS transporter, SHS family, lactate transporter [Methylocapsa palsarum]
MASRWAANGVSPPHWQWRAFPPNSAASHPASLQAGYPSGYLLASLLYLAVPWLGWRGMSMVGIIPALLAFFIRRNV